MGTGTIAGGIDVAAGICRTFEGYRAKPYLCPAGVWTIGYGATRLPGNGEPVTADTTPISEQTASEWLMIDLSGRVAGVLKACPVLVDDPRRLGAVLSWTFNLGAARLRASTMRLRINERDWPDAAIEMRKWKRGGGRVLGGLVKRRAVESALLENA